MSQCNHMLSSMNYLIVFLITTAVVATAASSKYTHYSRNDPNMPNCSYYDALVTTAEWLWDHSDSTKHSSSGDEVIDMVHDIMIVIESPEEEKRRFVNATLLFFLGTDYTAENSKCCRRQSEWGATFDIDYHPGYDLSNVIKLAQPLSRRHWPWKTRVGVSAGMGDRHLFVCQGYRCESKYLCNVAPCESLFVEFLKERL